MKKDKEWLKNELLNSRSVNRGMILTIGEVMELVYQLDEPEKPIIPKFVATFIEDSRNKVGCIVTAIWEMYEYEYKRVYEWALEDGNDEVLMKAFANGYEVEKEKLYYISFPKPYLGCIKMWRNKDTGSYYFAKSNSVTSQDGYECVFTEKEIKEHDERFWPFAVEVTE